MTDRPGGFSEVPDQELEGAPPPTGDAAPETGLGAILDRSWNVFTSRFWALVGFQFLYFILVLAVVIAVIAAVFAGIEDPEGWGRELEHWDFERDGITGPVATLIGVGALVGLLLFALQFVVQGAVTWLSFRQMQGGKGSFGEAFAVGAQRAFPVMLVVLVSALVIIACVALPVMAAVAATTDFSLERGFGDEEPPPGPIIGAAVVGLIPLVLLATGWWLVVPVMIVERRWFSALGRSWSLTKGHRLTIFGLIVILQLLSTALGAVPIVGPLLQLAAGTFAMVVPAIAYYAIRHAKEGIGLEQMVNVFE